MLAAISRHPLGFTNSSITCLDLHLNIYTFLSLDNKIIKPYGIPRLHLLTSN